VALASAELWGGKNIKKEKNMIHSYRQKMESLITEQLRLYAPDGQRFEHLTLRSVDDA